MATIISDDTLHPASDSVSGGVGNPWSLFDNTGASITTSSEVPRGAGGKLWGRVHNQSDICTSSTPGAVGGSDRGDIVALNLQTVNGSIRDWLIKVNREHKHEHILKELEKSCDGCSYIRRWCNDYGFLEPTTADEWLTYILHVADHISTTQRLPTSSQLHNIRLWLNNNNIDEVADANRVRALRAAAFALRTQRAVPCPGGVSSYIDRSALSKARRFSSVYGCSSMSLKRSLSRHPFIVTTT